METWLTFGKEFGTTPENIYDADLQVKVAQLLLDKGEFWHWKTCVAKTINKLGPYPL